MAKNDQQGERTSRVQDVEGRRGHRERKETDDEFNKCKQANSSNEEGIQMESELMND